MAKFEAPGQKMFLESKAFFPTTFTIEMFLMASKLAILIFFTGFFHFWDSFKAHNFM